MEPCLEAICDYATEGAWFVREAAVAALTDVAPEIAVPACAWRLRGKLGHADAAVRQGVLEVLAHWVRSLSREDVGSLMVCLDDDDTFVREAVLELLQRCNAAQRQPHLPSLVAALNDQEPELRIAALRALAAGDGAVGVADAALATGLRAGLADDDDEVRAAAVELLGHTAAWPDEASAPLLDAAVERLTDGCACVRAETMHFFSSLSEARRDVAIGHIRALLSDVDASVRCAAVHFLGACSPMQRAPHLGALASALADGDADVRRHAVLAFARCSVAERVAQLPAVAALLDDGDASVRRAAIELFGGAATAERQRFGAQILNRASHDDDIDVQCRAARVGYACVGRGGDERRQALEVTAAHLAATDSRVAK